MNLNQFRPTSITIENFKGFSKPVTIPLKPITLLFGKNSAGKSTILQSLLYLGEVLKTNNGDVDEIRLAGKAIKLGGFENIVNGQDTSKVITIKINFDASAINWDRLSPIEEFIIELEHEQGKKAITIDASDVGESLEKGSIEFEIGHIKGVTIPHKYTLISTKIIFDDIVFATINPFTTRDGEKSVGLDKHIILNEIHPLFGINEEEPFTTKNNLLQYCDCIFQSPILDAYLKGVSLNIYRKGTTQVPKPLSKNDIVSYLSDHQDDEIAQRFKKTDIEILNDFKTFNADTLILYYDVQCDGLIIIGQCLQNKVLKIHQIIKPKDHTAIYDIKMTYLSTQFYPILKNNRLETVKLPPTRSSFIENDEEEALDDKTKLTNTLHKKNCELFFRQFLSRFFFASVNLVKQFIEGNRYIGPIREIPGRNHETPLSNVNERWSSGLAAWDVLLKDTFSRQLINKTNEHLRNTLQIQYEIQKTTNIDLPESSNDTDSQINKFLKAEKLTIEEMQDLKDLLKKSTKKSSLHIKDLKNNVLLSLNDIGVGISQVIPVIVASINSPNITQPAAVSIEQPELHLHPSLQCSLADLFILEKDIKRPFLLETHSEHLILRLLRRIRETNDNELKNDQLSLKPEDIAVLYVDNRNQTTEISEMHVTPDGDFLDHWPEGFFEERATELFGE